MANNQFVASAWGQINAYQRQDGEIFCYYTLQPGDDANPLAFGYHTTYAALIDANPLGIGADDAHRAVINRENHPGLAIRMPWAACSYAISLGAASSPSVQTGAVTPVNAGQPKCPPGQHPFLNAGTWTCVASPTTRQAPLTALQALYCPEGYVLSKDGTVCIFKNPCPGGKVPLNGACVPSSQIFFPNVAPTRSGAALNGSESCESCDEDVYVRTYEPVVIPRLTDITFEEATCGGPVLVTFSAPKTCPKCPLQVPALQECLAQGIPVYHVDVEQADSQRLSALRPGYVGTPRNKDGSKGTPRMMPDMRVPAHYVYAGGRPVARQTGLTAAEDLTGFYRHGQQVAALGRLGTSLWP